MNQRNSDTERLYWSREEIGRYQFEQLRWTVGQSGKAPFYSSRPGGVDLQSLDDITRLPLLSKEDARAASPFGLVAVEPDELFQYHESFGTTGVPVSSWMTRNDLESYSSQINHSGVNLQPSDRCLVRFPYAISTPAHIFTQAARNRGACVVPVSSRTAVSPYPRVIDLLRKLEVTVLGCLPMEAIWLAETAREMGLVPAQDFPHLRAICTAGELLTAVRRQRIERLWDARVFNMYGCTEGGNIAADCEHGGLHLSWDHFLLEVLDEHSGQPAPADTIGSAVLTTLTREAMPLIRFVLGDRLRIRFDHECPCGRQAPLLEHYGRDLNRFEFNGRTVYTRDLEERVLTAPDEAVGNLWLVEVRPREVRFRTEAAHPDADCYRQLERRVRDELQIPLIVEAVSPGALLDRSRLMQITPVKKPRVVQQVPAEADPLTLDDIMAG